MGSFQNFACAVGLAVCGLVILRFASCLVDNKKEFSRVGSHNRTCPECDPVTLSSLGQDGKLRQTNSKQCHTRIWIGWKKMKNKTNAVAHPIHLWRFLWPTLFASADQNCKADQMIPDPVCHSFFRAFASTPPRSPTPRHALLRASRSPWASPRVHHATSSGSAGGVAKRQQRPGRKRCLESHLYTWSNSRKPPSSELDKVELDWQFTCEALKKD